MPTPALQIVIRGVPVSVVQNGQTVDAMQVQVVENPVDYPCHALLMLEQAKMQIMTNGAQAEKEKIVAAPAGIDLSKLGGRNGQGR